MVVTVLTSAGHSNGHASGMPGADTGDLAKTLVCLAGQLGGSPTLGDTLESLTLGHADDVDRLELGEDLADGDLLLEAFKSPLDLELVG